MIRKAVFIFYFFSLIMIHLQGMEQDNNLFTVSPNILELIPSQLYTKYGYGENINYFQHSNNLVAIEIFCQSNNGKNNFSTFPREIKLCILEWCNLTLGFKGFLHKQFLMSLQKPIFHFTDFDAQLNGKNSFKLKITLKNPNDTFDSTNIISTLQKHQLLDNSITFKAVDLPRLNQEYQKNGLLELPARDTMIGFPFTTIPLFPQQLHYYHNGHLYCPYLSVNYFRQNNTALNNLSTAVKLNENWYVKSFYCFLDNKKRQKIYFVELMDETIEGENFVHPSQVIASQNHHIKIFKSHFDSEIFEEIQTIILPVMNQITLENPQPTQSSEPFSNARFDIETIVNGVLILHDKQYDRYPSFALPENNQASYSKGFKEQIKRYTEQIKIYTLKIALFFVILFLLYNQKNLLCNQFNLIS